MQVPWPGRYRRSRFVMENFPCGIESTNHVQRDSEGVLGDRVVSTRFAMGGESDPFNRLDPKLIEDYFPVRKDYMRNAKVPASETYVPLKSLGDGNDRIPKFVFDALLKNSKNSTGYFDPHNRNHHHLRHDQKRKSRGRSQHPSQQNHILKSHNEWNPLGSHRYTSKDWIRILRDMPHSVTLKRIRDIITAHMIWTFVLAVVDRFFFELPKVGNPALVTPALGLLLVFRTNAAYNRFWEGRKIWEKLLDKSRTLVRYAALYEESAGKERVDRIVRLVVALALSLKQHLTSFRASELRYCESQLGGSAIGTGEVCVKPRGARSGFDNFTDPERVAFRKVKNRPLFISNKLAETVHSIPTTDTFTSRERIQLLRMVDSMTSYVGACERIVQTPVPLNYARHTSRFLTFWCLSLPLTLVPDLSFFAIPIMALIVWGLFGIQEIGLMIEEPFRSYLPINAFTQSIYDDVRENLATARAVRRRQTSSTSLAPQESSLKISVEDGSKTQTDTHKIKTTILKGTAAVDTMTEASLNTTEGLWKEIQRRKQEKKRSEKSFLDDCEDSSESGGPKKLN